MFNFSSISSQMQDLHAICRSSSNEVILNILSGLLPGEAKAALLKRDNNDRTPLCVYLHREERMLAEYPDVKVVKKIMAILGKEEVKNLFRHKNTTGEWSVLQHAVYIDAVLEEGDPAPTREYGKVLEEIFIAIIDFIGDGAEELMVEHCSGKSDQENCLQIALSGTMISDVLIQTIIRLLGKTAGDILAPLAANPSKEEWHCYLFYPFIRESVVPETIRMVVNALGSRAHEVLGWPQNSEYLTMNDCINAVVSRYILIGGDRNRTDDLDERIANALPLVAKVLLEKLVKNEELTSEEQEVGKELSIQLFYCAVVLRPREEQLLFLKQFPFHADMLELENYPQDQLDPFGFPLTIKEQKCRKFLCEPCLHQLNVNNPSNTKLACSELRRIRKFIPKLSNENARLFIGPFLNKLALAEKNIWLQTDAFKSGHDFSSDEVVETLWAMKTLISKISHEEAKQFIQPLFVKFNTEVCVSWSQRARDVMTDLFAKLAYEDFGVFLEKEGVFKNLLLKHDINDGDEDEYYALFNFLSVLLPKLPVALVDSAELTPILLKWNEKVRKKALSILQMNVSDKQVGILSVFQALYSGENSKKRAASSLPAVENIEKCSKLS